MSKDKVDILKDNLKIVRADYKAAMKADKQRYKQEKKYIKRQLKELRHHPNANPLKKKVNFLEKFENLSDSAILRICEPFEVKAQAIRYKQRDPEGYEADMVVDDSVKIIRYYSKRVAKGKKLKDRDQVVLFQLLMTLGVISNKKMGYRHEEAGQLAKTIEQLTKDLANSVGAKQVAAMIDDFSLALDSLQPLQS